MQIEDEVPGEPGAEVVDLGSRRREQVASGRTHRLTPRFSAEELAEVVAAAASVAMTPTGFCADSALAAARGTPVALGPAQEREAHARLLRELFAARTAVNRFGVNVNQAVAALNATGEAPAWLDRAVALCARSVARLDEVIGEVRRRLQ